MSYEQGTTNLRADVRNCLRGNRRVDGASGTETDLAGIPRNSEETEDRRNSQVERDRRSRRHGEEDQDRRRQSCVGRGRVQRGEEVEVRAFIGRDKCTDRDDLRFTIRFRVGKVE